MRTTAVEMLWYMGIMIGGYALIMVWVKKSKMEPWKNQRVMTAFKAAAAIGLTMAGGYAAYNKTIDRSAQAQNQSP